MARNAEKAQDLLNKWVTMKQEFGRTGNEGPKRRPYLSSECDDLSEAEKWRLYDALTGTEPSLPADGIMQEGGLRLLVQGLRPVGSFEQPPMAWRMLSN